jgi:hypothetical protein
MEGLKEILSNYTDKELLDRYKTCRGDYVEEAVKLFDEELARRGLDPEAHAAARDSVEAAVEAAVASAKNLKRADFAPLPHPFLKADVVTADAVLRGSNVPYIIEERRDGSAGQDGAGAVIMGQTGAVELPPGPAQFNIMVYKDAMEKARELIGEHFEAGIGDGVYVPRRTDVVDRLKSFSLYDIRMSDAAEAERLAVDFTEKERGALIKLAETLVAEADRIEEEQGRVVFFYDSMEPLAGKLKNGEALTRTDFLAIIELCQIYCDDPRYDAELNQTAASILSFFLE